MARPPRPPAKLWPIVWGNALWASALYLLLGVALEVLRLFHPVEWVQTTSDALDGLPSWALFWAGLLSPVRRLYEDGQLSGPALRALFGATTVLVIFALAALLGAVSWAALKLTSVWRPRDEADPSTEQR